MNLNKKMRVKVNNWACGPFKNDCIEYGRSWISPDKKFAILEVWKDELYLAVKVVVYRVDEDRENICICDFLEQYRPYYYDECSIRLYSADFSHMEDGYFKLVCEELEYYREKNRRFVFDREKYNLRKN